MKNLSVLSSKDFFLVLAFQKKARQSISSCIGLALTIIDPEMISKEFLSPTNLTKAQAPFVIKLSKVIMVGEHRHFVLAAF